MSLFSEVSVCELAALVVKVRNCSMDCILIGDPDPVRFDHVRKVLQDAFVIDVFQIENFEQLCNECKIGSNQVKLILLTAHLPFGDQSKNILTEAYFERLPDQMLPVGYLYEDEPTPSVPEGITFFPFPSPAKKIDFFLTLKAENFSFELRLPQITLDENDFLLKAQVTILSASESLEEGKLILSELAGRFLSGELKVHRLRSGYSGAIVLRIHENETGSDYVLKLSQEAWKLKLEAKQHPIVAGGIPGLHEYRAKLLKPKPQVRSIDHVASCGRWSAICLGFLGGPEFGQMIDLQEALIGPPATFLAHPLPIDGKLDQYRAGCLDFVLQWLKREWCMNTKHATRSIGQPWYPDHAPDKIYPPTPPYCLTKRVKDCIREFFDGKEAQIGARLTPKYWNETVAIVKSFLECKEDYRASKLDCPIPMVLSPSHGDLNSNNILFFLDLPDPIFFIDFPQYQAQGHALQDFARLEIEVKYALMDRQMDTPAKKLAGFDLTPTQFAMWLKLENHLQGDNWWKIKKLRQNGFPKNVRLSLQLVQNIREAAKQVQQQKLGDSIPSSFDDEYLFPLLYHTLQSITYASLSPYKRLLAVHSSAMLLERAGFALGKRKHVKPKLVGFAQSVLQKISRARPS